MHLINFVEELHFNDSIDNDEKQSKTKKAPITSDTELLYTKIDLLEKEMIVAKEEAYKIGIQDCEINHSHEKEIIISDLRNEFAGLIKNLNQQYKESIETVFTKVSDMGVTLANNILDHEISNPDKIEEILKNQISKAYAKVVDEDELVLRLNPSSMNLFEKHNMLAEMDLSSEKLKIITDDNLRHGECMLENIIHVIDGRFTTQLMNLIKAIEISS
ncbi:MAG: hypothetical protein HN729_06600 [Candidatus Marinimicrobia bacterium]|jgi:flagellar biosynthesis/type III secretory pathway protein FliH|nr:hypothetical protein [Candidatus Neomarinimicrobiota bacterium]MBT3633709.1 hypothetical protein [Candidatus Neomarinimicrobiota bacterium]MBT3682338.1 hypothetical protein [Candidatus Neomarinimicrobiota bacterium]MBT3759102.1 hypothetical protein [Candidatus Neomarinimicrobiota bacterium]MBT3895625.1 hypothetical protein [Candidatus Neomarinimicrobiota bacterium]